MITTTRTGRHAAAAMLLFAATLVCAPPALADFTCKPGWACPNPPPPSGCVNNSGCAPCSAGTYNAHWGGTCRSCAKDSIADSLGATSCQQCNYKGHTGYHSNGAHTSCLKLPGSTVVVPGGLLETGSPKFGTSGPAATGSPLSSGPSSGGARSGGAGVR